MSVESLATGDVVVKQADSNAVDASWGNVPTHSDVASLTCLVQTPAAREVTQFATRGMNLTHNIFFAADPGLTNNNRLKLTVRAGATLATPRFFRVLGAREEGRPGETLLWIAHCEEVTTRLES